MLDGYTGHNWLDTTNPFGLAKPPESWLLLLQQFDDQLVVFPSMQEPAYILARRVTRSPGILRLASPERHPDLRFCWEHRLLGVTGIQPFHTVWNLALIEDLRKMDKWRMGGDDKFADHIERLDAERAARLDAATNDEADQRGSSAWFGKQVRTGSTTFVQGYQPPASNVIPSTQRAETS
jgi:hypothetical protein